MWRSQRWRLYSFGGQLTGLLLLAVILTAGLLAWGGGQATVRQLERAIERDNARMLELLAQQSTPALLHGNPDLAEVMLRSFARFDDVRALVLLDSQGRYFAGEQVSDTRRAAAHRVNSLQVFSEDSEAWHLAAPILSLDTPAQRLGTVYLHRDKRALIDSKRETFFNNLLLAALAVPVLAWLFHQLARRMLRPIRELSGAMKRGGEQGSYEQVRPYGPIEVRDMAEQYNRLMQTLGTRDQRIRQHADELESDVWARTAELVQARDEALAASRTKSEFLANMSHELRTPLQAIIGYTDVLRDEWSAVASADALQDLRRINDGADHLLGVINNILDIAKIEAGRVEVHWGVCDLRLLIQDVAHLVRPLTARNGNRLQLELDAAACEPLVSDPQKLKQILVNLLGNANKFTREGDICVRAHRNADALVLAVHDNGIGIDAALQARIFEPFAQAESGENRRFGGTGLGLSICRQLCQLLGGEITVESAPGQGACFSVRVPWRTPLVPEEMNTLI